MAVQQLRWLPVFLGIEPEFPTATISAAESASGRSVAHGGSASGGVTFKFELSGLSRDFGEHAIEHNCPPRSRFLGMKRTFYLQCAHAPGLDVSVEVLPSTFTVVGRLERNRVSEAFVLSMV